MKNSDHIMNHERGRHESFFTENQSLIFREIIDSVPFSAAYLDSALTLRYASRGMLQMTGLRSDEITGKDLDFIWGKECYELARKLTLKSSDKPIQFALRVKNESGPNPDSYLEFKLKPVNNSGSDYGYILTAAPAASAFTGHEELFKIINSLPVAILLRDISDFYNPKLIYINDTARKLYEADTDLPLESINITKLMSDDPANEGKYQEISENLSQYGESPFEIEALTLRGKKFPAEGYSRIIKLNEKNALLTMIRDITRRKENEKNLKLKDLRYEAVLASALDGFIVIDEDGVITYTNNAYCNMSGYSRGEIIGQSIFMFDASGDNETPLRVKSELFEKGFSSFETVHRRKNGSVWAAELSISIQNNENNMTYGFIRDISKRKEAEKLIISNAKRMKSLLDAVPDLIFRIKRDGTYLDFKAKEDELFLRPEMFLGKKMKDVLPPEVAELCQKELEAAFTAGKVHVFEYSLMIDGEKHFYEARVNADPATGESVMIVRDLTEKRKAEEELAFSNELINLTNSIAKIGGWQHYLSSGKTFWTDEIKRIFEIDDLNDFSIDAVEACLLPESGAVLNECLIKAVTQNISCSHDFRIITRKGAPKWVRAIIQPVSEGGKVSKIRGSFQDISSEKENELILELERKRLRTLVETLPDVVVVKDPQGVFLYCNRQFELLYGHTEQEILGKTDYDFVDKAQADLYKDMDTYAFESNTQVHNTEVLNYATDGRNVVLHTIKTPLVNSAGEKYALLTIARDITEQYKNEQKLKKEHDYVVNILETMSDAFVALDNHENYTYVNSNACSIFGMSRFEILGRCMWEEFPALVGSPFEDVYREAVRSGKSLIMEEHYEPMGKWFENYINPRKDGVLVFFRDITERKIASQKIESERKRLRTLIEAMPDLVWLKDKDGVYQLCNAQFENHFGIRESELTGKTDLALADLKTAEQFRKNDLAAIESNKSITIKEELIAADGRKRTFETIKTPVNDSEGALIGVLGISRDITDLLMMNEALRESEKRLKEAQKIAGMGYWDYDIEGNRLLWSEELYEIFEIERAESGVSYESFLNSIHPDDREGVENLFRSSMESEGEFSITHRLLLSEGRIKYIQERWVTYNDLNGVPVRLMGTSQNVTAQKLAEDEIISLNQNLEEKVKQRTRELENLNHELESFAYSVSHDLRAPLRAIDGFSSIIMDDFSGQLSEEGNRYFGRIRTNISRMGEMIEDILSLSRITRNPMRIADIDFSGLVKEVCEQLKESAPERVIEFNIQEGIQVAADRGLIRNVCENLLGNAVKFTSKKEKAVIEVGAVNLEGGTEVFVRDNGAGFDMAYYDKLFGVFQRLHHTDDFPGTGVGLATVQRIMNRHGGVIRAESKPGEGAAFYLFFKNLVADDKDAEQ